VIDDDGFVIFESQAIMFYLIEKYDTNNVWFPKDIKGLIINI
jgi:glutathione S-transferase